MLECDKWRLKKRAKDQDRLVTAWKDLMERMKEEELKTVTIQMNMTSALLNLKCIRLLQWRPHQCQRHQWERLLLLLRKFLHYLKR
jgi:hypothetical protein